MHRRLAIAVGIRATSSTSTTSSSAACSPPCWPPSGTSPPTARRSCICSRLRRHVLRRDRARHARRPLGRRRMFLIEPRRLLGVHAGAPRSAPNLTWLAILRFFAGIGLGGRAVAVGHLPERVPARARCAAATWPRAYTLGFFGVPLAAFIGGEVRGRRAPAASTAGAGCWSSARSAPLIVFAMRAQPARVAALATRSAAARRRPSATWRDDRGGGARAAAACRCPSPTRSTARRRRTASLREIFEPRVPPAHRDAVDLPVPPDRRLLRVRHAGAARARRAKGYDIVESLGFTAVIFLGYPLGLGALDPADGALRAQAPDRRAQSLVMARVRHRVRVRARRRG